MALRNAVELRSRAVDGFIPYHFDFALHGEESNTIHAPWYSGMAQGQLLSLACRLAELTGASEWQGFARLVLSTLSVAHRFDALPTEPWVTFIDQQDMLWFEEYAGDVEPMRVLNGHIFAMFGLYDFWVLTGSEEAEDLFRRGAETVLSYADRLRVPGQASWYGVRVQDNPIAQSAKYHRIHICQLRHIAAMTDDSRFERIADALASDIGLTSADFSLKQI